MMRQEVMSIGNGPVEPLIRSFNRRFERIATGLPRPGLQLTQNRIPGEGFVKSDGQTELLNEASRSEGLEGTPRPFVREGALWAQGRTCVQFGTNVQANEPEFFRGRCGELNKASRSEGPEGTLSGPGRDIC
jgi:hypothetical protein